MSIFHHGKKHYNHGSYDPGQSNVDGDGVHFGSVLPGLGALMLRATLGVSVVFYILNQQHLLSRQLSSVVSKALFWPTLPITVLQRVGKWVTNIDDTVVMGGAPFGFMGYPKKLQQEYEIKGVINMCEEYRGPVRQYKELDIEELYLPTTDHFEPSEDDMLSALSFMKRHEELGNRVYVHCRAGHGRSGAVVLAWMLTKYPDANLQKLNVQLCEARKVRKGLWNQPNIQALHRRFRENGGSLVNVQDPFFLKDQIDTKKER